MLNPVATECRIRHGPRGKIGTTAPKQPSNGCSETNIGTKDDESPMSAYETAEVGLEIPRSVSLNGHTLVS
jgi:hypothetical protein